MHTASLAFRFGLAELRWIAAALWGHVRWFHRFWFVVAMFTWLAADILGSWKPFTIVGAIALYFALWARFYSDTYYRAVSRPLARRELWLDLLETWPLLMEECGLSRVVIDRAGEKHTRVPSIASKHWDRNQLVLFPSLLTGQTVEDFQDVADRLRTTVGATHLRVTGELSPTLTFSFGNALAETVNRGLPDHDEPWDGRSVWMGIDTTDDDWRLRIAGTHTLVAGSSGSGKASLVWGVTIGLAPAIARGEAQVHGIDLKGGVELGMGKDLFTRYAVTPAEAVVVLEDAVEAMSARLERMAGNTRQHIASADEPLVVVLIDEVAALTSYIEDRDLKNRARTAMSLLCSQGRAVGYTVVACLQDPRKETIPNRGLFTQMVGLRLRDREETSMVLGDGAIASGALCHKIPLASPGIGYVVPEDGSEPVRVRAAFVYDDLIRAAAERFPAPSKIPVVIPEPTEKPRSSRARTRTKPDTEGTAS
ncbi:FtsK/SpoIIIE domain-containing protein [uncultured Brachybacterium sp.]|uniref:FtsK/SpoIIIE domain-containing protein n=1 Tax=uncultured Brachybacterium sp. TaxID=189680 RepID=UPI002623CE50|nr:FtsK/SpoIIIE domain-containing protein [uncultured Brachybacterium sp.]